MDDLSVHQPATVQDYHLHLHSQTWPQVWWSLRCYRPLCLFEHLQHSVKLGAHLGGNIRWVVGKIGRKINQQPGNMWIHYQYTCGSGAPGGLVETNETREVGDTLRVSAVDYWLS